MPYLNIKTNIHVPNTTQPILFTELSAALAKALGKSENSVMLELHDESPMFFRGTSDPTAYLILKTIDLPTLRTTELSQLLCEEVERLLDVPKERIFIEFDSVDRSLWGWNSKTFAKS